MKPMKRSNCLFFWFALRWRRARRGKPGGMYIRKSHHGWFWHFAYQYRQPTGQHRMVSFVPVDPIDGLWFPPVFFDGRIQWGDPPLKENHDDDRNDEILASGLSAEQ
jgi:hypothetical protein